MGEEAAPEAAEEAKPEAAKGGGLLSKIIGAVGIKSIGNVLKSRKGIVCAGAAAVGYYALLGRLPDDASPELVNQMADKFVLLVEILTGLFVTGTALEDSAGKIAGLFTKK